MSAQPAAMPAEAAPSLERSLAVVDPHNLSMLAMKASPADDEAVTSTNGPSGTPVRAENLALKTSCRLSFWLC